YRDEHGDLVGVEAVIDKDHASSLLAASVKADLLLISTEVEKVALNFKKENQQWLEKVTLAEAKQYLADGHFLKGSMEPNGQAVINFLDQGGGHAIITNPPNMAQALSGETGTHFTA